MQLKHLSTWAAVAAALGSAPLLMAADHLDGPGVQMDPAADITDLYAFPSLDGARVNLIMNVFPLADTSARFSESVQYVFHTASQPTLGSNSSSALNIICTFGANQTVSCWAGDSYVTGDASGTAGLTSMDGKLKVFAGLRDDPAFFNLNGFKDLVASVSAAAPAITFDANQCPSLDNATSAALVNILSHTSQGSMPGTDFFAGKNVLSLVVSVEKALLTAGGPIVSISASTRK